MTRCPDNDDPGIPVRWLRRGMGLAILLAPLLWWFNGPAVSGDQRSVRWIALTILLVAVALMRRGGNRERREQRRQQRRERPSVRPGPRDL